MTRKQTTSYRGKGRAVFLAAIMVLSVVAIAMAFAGGAAAQDLTDFEDQSVNSDGEVVVEGVEDADGLFVIVTESDVEDEFEDDTIVGATEVDGEDAQDVSVDVLSTETNLEGDFEATTVAEGDTGEHAAHIVDPEAEEFSVGDTAEDTYNNDTEELQSVSEASLGAVEDSTGIADITADSFEMSNADPGTVSLLPGDEFDISVNANNTAIVDDEQEISIEADGGDVVNYSTTAELDAGEENATVDFTNVEVDEDAEQGSYDLNISSEAADEDSQEVATLLVGDEDREGSLNVEVRGDFDADTDDPVNVTLYGNADGSANVDDPTQRIETLQTDDDGEVDFRGLAVNGSDEEDGINYAAAAAQDDDNFDSDVDRATLWNDRTSTSLTVFIDRTITADEINVENKDPASGVTDLDSNITLDTEVLSVDLPEDDPDDELNPFPDNEVSVAIVGGNADDVGAGNGSLIVEGDSVEDDGPVSVTDDDGIANWDFALDDVDDDDVDGEDVEFTVEFAPEDENNNSVRATADLTFQPDIGDTGTISGEVDRVNDDITLGAQDRSSNIEPAEGVPVHAVELDSVVDNTANLAAESDNFKQLNESNLDPLEGIDSFDDANLSSNFATTTTGLEELNETNQSVRLDQGDQIRAVTYDEDGGEVPLDPRSDYLVTTDNSDIELVQNESSPAVEIHDDDGSDGEINFHFIDDSEYQLQQRVELTNTSSGESTATWQNTTVADVDVEDDLTRDATNQQDFPDVRFDAVEDLSYDAIDEQFEDDRVVPTDYTNSNGDYELLNLPTDFDEEKQYVVIAGAGDTESAVDDEAVGFANFAGYDTVAVSPNADSDASQLNTDLSVQDFEPITEIEYRLDAEVEGVTGDFEKSTDVEQGDDREVVVDVEQREIGTDDWQTAADGVEITLGLTDNPTDPGDVGNLTDEVVETEDGEVSTTFEAFTAGEGTVNVTATTENTDDSLAEAEDGEQAEITVFGAATITGDIVNEDGENLPGADVRLAENASEIDEGNFVNERQAGEFGSFTFTERLDTNELLQSGQNYTVQAEFNDSTATRSYENLTAGTNDGDIVITGVEPEDANFNIANVEPGEDLEVNASDDVDVNATIENIGDEVGTQDIEFVVDDQVVDSEQLELAFGENESVDLSAVAPAEEGTYEWFIQTEDDTSDTWELNVTGDGEPGEPGFDLEDYETEDGDVETDGLRDAIDDWRDEGIETDDLRTVIDAWRN